MRNETYVVLFEGHGYNGNSREELGDFLEQEENENFEKYLLIYCNKKEINEYISQEDYDRLEKVLVLNTCNDKVNHRPIYKKDIERPKRVYLVTVRNNHSSNTLYVMKKENMTELIDYLKEWYDLDKVIKIKEERK